MTLWLAMLVIVQRMPDLISTRHPSRDTLQILCPPQTPDFLAISPLGLRLMSKRPFYLLAIMFFLASLLTGIAAQTKASKAAKFAAIATVADNDDDRLVFRNLSRVYAAEFGPLMTTSLVVLAAGVVAWIVSSRRRESGMQSIPLLLMIFAVFIQLLMV